MTNPKKQRTFISFEIDPETREAFSQQVKSEGKTVSAVLKQYIDDYLNSVENSKSSQDLTQVIKRLEEVEKKVAIQNARLLGESAA